MSGFPVKRTGVSSGAFRLTAIFLSAFALVSVEAVPGLRPGVTLANATELLRRAHAAGARTLSPAEVEKIQETFLQGLDPQGLYFMEPDLKELLSRPLDLGAMSAGNTLWLDAVIVRYRQRLQEALLLSKEAAASRPDYAGGELILYAPGKVRYAANLEGLRKRWKQIIQYRVLFQAYHAAGPAGEKPEQILQKREEEFRAAAARREAVIVQGVLLHPDGFEYSVCLGLLNEILLRYDPHTQLISSAEMQRFQTSLSSQAFSYGLVPSRSLSGETRIERLIPGGPAWKSGKLNKGDVVLEIRFPDDGRSLQAIDLGPAELDAAIGDPRSSRMILTVRKPGGLIERVLLVKEKLKNEENRISGFVLKGKSKIGYIYLPSFYQEWDQDNAPGCASDIAREILKLKREGIEGLIFDLRGNGGGSVREAVELAGIFIDQGPLFIQAGREKPLVVKDADRGTVYEGPLVLLLDGHSASASEIFASTMKDYNRAVIVGSPTFGKGTGQMILRAGSMGMRGEEYLKLTTNIYYNLYGLSHQFQGVKPDVPLPDLAGAAGERSLPNALRAPPIEKRAAFQKLPQLDLEDIAEESEDRVSSDRGFREIQAFGSDVQELLEESREVPLSPSKFVSYVQEVSAVFEKLERASTRRTSDYSVENHSFESEILQIDPFRRELNTEIRTHIQEDIFVEESYRVMRDVLDQLR